MLLAPLLANMVLLNQVNISLVDPEEECSFAFYIGSLLNAEHLSSTLSAATYLLTLSVKRKSMLLMRLLFAFFFF